MAGDVGILRWVGQRAVRHYMPLSTLRDDETVTRPPSLGLHFSYLLPMWELSHLSLVTSTQGSEV